MVTIRPQARPPPAPNYSLLPCSHPLQIPEAIFPRHLYAPAPNTPTLETVMEPIKVPPDPTVHAISQRLFFLLPLSFYSGFCLSQRPVFAEVAFRLLLYNNPYGRCIERWIGGCHLKTYDPP